MYIPRSTALIRNQQGTFYCPTKRQYILGYPGFTYYDTANGYAFQGNFNGDSHYAISRYGGYWSQGESGSGAWGYPSGGYGAATTYPRLRVSEITRPAAVALVADGAFWVKATGVFMTQERIYSDYRGWTGAFSLDGDPSSVRFPIHRGGANVGFFDGHVEYLAGYASTNFYSN